MRQLVLSLFPGIGMLDMAFEEEGFCVVRGPDLLWGGDVRGFHPPAGKFDGVIGGDPCQAHSTLRAFVMSNHLTIAEDMSAEYARCVTEARPRWFLRENVTGAPALDIPIYHQRQQVVRDVWCGGETSRKRRFTFGTLKSTASLRNTDNFHIETLALHRPDPEPAVLASGGEPPGWIPTPRHIATRKGRAVIGHKTTKFLGKAIRLQGLPADFLSEAPFTVAAKVHAVGNGVPLPMGRAVARAVKRAISTPAPSSPPTAKGET